MYRQFVAATIGLIAWLSLSCSLIAQCQPRVFDPSPLPGVDGKIDNLTAWDPDGAGPIPPRLVAFGGIVGAGTSAAQGAVMFDGSAWQRLPTPNLGSFFPTRSIDHDGVLHIATNARVYRLNGTAWTELVRVAANDILSFNHDLYAAGSVGGNSGVFRWDGSAWSMLGSPFAASTLGLDLNSLIEFQGQLIVAGVFGGAGAATFDSIAAWNGTSWQPLGSGFLAAGQNSIRGLAVWNNSLAALVQSINGSSTTISLHAYSGGNWTPVASNISTNVTRIFSDGPNLYTLGGRTPNIGYSSLLSRWNGSSFEAVATDTPVSASASTATSAVLYNGQIALGGKFAQLNGRPLSNVAVLSETGWKPIGPGFDGAPVAFAKDGDRVVAVGPFRHAGNIEALSAAVFDGSSWGAMGRELLPSVTTVKVVSGETVAAGTDILNTPGGPVAVARYDGVEWQPMGARRIRGRVDSLVQFNGSLVAIGYVELDNPFAAGALATWNGAEWDILPTGLPNALVGTQYNQNLMIGRFPLSPGEQPVLRWDGATAQQVSPGFAATAPLSTSPKSMTVFGNNLILGGIFSTAGGVAAHNIATFDGLTWRPMGQGIDGDVVGLLPFRGRLLAFDTAGNPSANQWNGSAWSALLSFTVRTTTAIETRGGELMLNGSSTLADGSRTYNIIRYSENPPCLGDFNCSGQASVQDIFDFLTLYFANEFGADIDSSPGVSLNDLFTFLEGFFSGC